MRSANMAALDHVNFFGFSPAFQPRRSYDGCIWIMLLLRQWIFYCATTTLLHKAPLLGACFEQGQKKLHRQPLMALRGTSATLMPFVSHSYSDPWCFSAVWTKFAYRSGSASQWNGGIRKLAYYVRDRLSMEVETMRYRIYCNKGDIKINALLSMLEKNNNITV